ncbi:MAG: hypothetical protein IJC85_02900 [Oscillospiraceae bacterium]|nr:hypothetical protein [Oscillospiraceae bacterium]
MATQKKKKKRIWPKILCAVLALSLLAMILVWTASGISGSYVTETAVAATADERIGLQGVVVRTATVVEKSETGVVCYVAEDGSRVAKGQILGYWCANEEEVRIRQEIDRLDDHIALLKEAGKNVALVNTQYESLTNQMNEAVIRMIARMTAGDYSQIDDCEAIYIPSSARRELAVDKQINFDATISALQAEREDLAKKINSNPKKVTAPVAGYFNKGGSHSVSPEEAEGLSAEQILAMSEEEGAAVGAISSDYVWSFLGVADASYTKFLTEGMTVELDLGLKDGITLPCVITGIKQDEKDETKLLVYVTCDYMVPEVAGIGIASADLIMDRHSGIRIPKEALRFEGTEAGVYVKWQHVMRFRKIEILYEGDTFLICKMNTDDKSQLRLYDEVIVKGADLYDGKVC